VNPGEVALAWLNSHASIMLKTAVATLVFDPVGVTIPKDVRPPDAVVITHEHVDHFDRRLVTEWWERFGIGVLGSSYIGRQIQGKATVVRVGQPVPVGDIQLVAEPCDHPANEPLSFVIMPSGLPAIYHSNDSDPFAEMVRIRRKYEPQLLLYTGASMSKASQIAEIFRPKIIVSCSCDRNWEKAFVEEVKSRSPATETSFIQPLEIRRWYG